MLWYACSRIILIIASSMITILQQERIVAIW